MMNVIEMRRTELLKWIEKYLSQRNIKMKYVLRKYRDRLMTGKTLSEKEFDHLVPLLKWNLKKSDRGVKEYFSCLIRGSRSAEPEERGTLEEFFQ